MINAVNSVYLLITGYIISLAMPLLCIFIQIFGLHIYKVSGRKIFTSLRKKYWSVSQYKQTDDYEFGLIISNKYIAMVESTSNIIDGGYIITTKKILDLEKEEKVQIKQTITSDMRMQDMVIVTKDSRERSRFVTRHIKNLTPSDGQSKIIKQILNIDTCFPKVVYICGESGVGKSSLGYIMSQNVSCNIVQGYKPWSKHMSFDSLISSYNFVTDKKIVVMIDEIDYILDKIVNNQPMNLINTSLNDDIELDGTKSTWNTYFDELKRIPISNIYIIFTSNIHYDHYNHFDISLLRKNRFDLCTELT
jgi:hypothetical protein